MIRRRLIHFMLALMLLVSQQMAFTHAMAHWANTREIAAGVEQGSDGRAASSLSQDQTCDKCLVFAQIASAVGSSSSNAAAVEAGSFAVTPQASQAVSVPLVHPYQSRAPPAVV